MVLLLLFSGSARGDETQSERKFEFDIESQAADLALMEFAEQADLTLVFPDELVRGKQAKALVGTYTLQEGIERLLAGTGLVPSFSNEIVLSISAGEPADGGEFVTTKKSTGLVALLASLFTGGAVAQEAVDDESALGRDEATTFDEIVVTGTHIRGIAPESSPVVSFSRDDIMASGVSTLADFVQLIPQNFGGGSNPDVPNGLPGDASGSFNTAQGSFASSVNLRGLGPGSTLVLLNGHRVAPTSGIGEFVDISMIPASAIERIDVLLDGASSIYGADAVAGVVNFVLRDDYDGVETSIRYGAVTEGDMDELRVGVTAGGSWGTGNAIFVYEHFDQDNLSAIDRAFAGDAPLPLDLLPSQRRIASWLRCHRNWDRISNFSQILLTPIGKLGIEAEFRRGN